MDDGKWQSCSCLTSNPQIAMKSAATARKRNNSETPRVPVERHNSWRREHKLIPPHHGLGIGPLGDNRRKLFHKVGGGRRVPGVLQIVEFSEEQGRDIELLSGIFDHLSLQPLLNLPYPLPRLSIQALFFFPQFRV